MSKKIIILLVILIFTINSSFSFFCDDTGKAVSNIPKSPVCEQTPDVINQYIESVVNVVSLMKMDINTQDNVEGLGNKALTPVVGAYEISEGLFTDFGTDFFSNFKILLDDKSIVRDWQKLMNLKEYIAKMVSSVIKNKSLNNSVNTDVLQRLKSITLTNNAFILKFRGTTYKQVYNYLLTNQQAMEDLYYNVVSKGKKDYTLSNEKYDVDLNHLNTIKQQLINAYYPKGNKVVCNTSFDDAIKKIKQVVCNYGQKKTNRAIDRFECNYKRLRNVLFGEAFDGACGSVQPVKAIPLEERIKVNGENITEVGKLMKLGKEEREFLDTIEQLPANIANFLKSKKIKTGMEVTVEQLPANIQKNMMITEIYNSVQDIDSLKQRTTESFQNVESNKVTHNITLQFPKISKQVYDMMRKINGKGGDYKDSAAGQMTEACRKTPPFVGDCRKTKK